MIASNKAESNKGKTSIDNLPSEKSFGLLFAALFCFFGLFGIINDWYFVSVVVLLTISAILIPISIFWFKLLTPLNKIWFSLGVLMGKVINPLILGIVFFFILTPVAFLGRLVGRDELKLNNIYTDISSYWINRESKNIPSESFKRQF